MSAFPAPPPNLLPTADDLASLLGLKEGDPEVCEEQRWNTMTNFYIPLLYASTEQKRSIIFSRFSALYLPQLVTAWRSTKRPAVSGTTEWGDLAASDLLAYSSYDMMLEHLQANAYFAKFMESKEPKNVELRKDMGPILARRLAARMDDWDKKLCPTNARWTHGSNTMHTALPSPQVITSTTQLLSYLLAFETTVALHALAREPQVRKLAGYLEKWQRKFPDGDIGHDTCERTAALLRANPMYIEMAHGIRKMTEGPKGKRCAICGKTDNLSSCSKCKTVRYCCVDHQRQAWKDPTILHKEMCHTTTF